MLLIITRYLHGSFSQEDKVLQSPLKICNDEYKHLNIRGRNADYKCVAY